MKRFDRIALDSSAIILYFRGHAAAVNLFADIQEIYLPLTAVGELFLGLERSEHKSRRLREVNELLAQANLLLPDLQTAKLYAQTKAKLLAAGKPIPDNDIWIATLALQANLPLAARDEHFGFVDSLELISL